MSQKLGLLCVSLALLSGCVTTSTKTDVSVVAITPKKLAIEEIKDIAVEARDELRLLAKYQQALAQESLTDAQHRQKYYQSVYIPEGFEKEVTLKVQDRAEDVAKAIAAVAGYDIDIQSDNLLYNPMVNINIKNQPLNEALKELGLQTGGLIDVEVYPASKLMVFKYSDSMR